jgi:2'-5' RNA ligase
MRRIRVIWVGLEGEQQAREALRTLQTQVAEQLAPLGYTPDKSFTPHLTLGRVRDTATREEMAHIAEVMTYPEEQPTFETSMRVNAISLMKSDLQPGGSVYTRLADLSLAREM